MRKVYCISLYRNLIKRHSLKDRIEDDLIFEDKKSAEDYLLKKGWHFYKEWKHPFTKVSYKNIYKHEEASLDIHYEIEELKVFENEEDNTM